MTRVYTKCFELLDGQTFNNLLQQMPVLVRNKILRLSLNEDRHASLFGKLLLEELMAGYGKRNFTIEDLMYTHYGKPHACNGVNFNISHSRKAVIVVGSSSRRIG